MGVEFNGFVFAEEIKTGLLLDESLGMYPSKMYGYAGDNPYYLGSETNTIYGYVYSGKVKLVNQGHEWVVSQGHYFSATGTVALTGTGTAILIERIGYRGVFQIGGKIEHRGRLAYIDGCSDSLLIHPARLGDPCLNLLVFPPKIRQTMHIHPSIRMGIVAEGRGRCITPEGEMDLVPGMVFVLKEMGQHCFYTDDEGMKVIAYHPDSDTGPNDEDHPMKNRTLTDYKR